MAEEDAEGVYSQFMLSEHQTSDPPHDGSTTAPAASRGKGKPLLIKDNERSRILGGIVRLVLRRAPFPTKFDEIRNIVKAHLHDKHSNAVVSMLVEEAKKLTGSIFGLTLCDVRLPGGKREVFLKQSLAFQPHDLKILGEGDHEFRGFLLLLVPCMKAYTAGIPLDRLCNLFSQIGKGHMVPQDRDSEEALATALRTPRRRKELRYHASDFRHISDYLLYARDLGYLRFQIGPDKSDGLNTILVCAGYRFVLEFDQASYVSQFRTLDIDPVVKRNLDVFFDT